MDRWGGSAGAFARRHGPRTLSNAAFCALAPALPGVRACVRAITASFGNDAQPGIPMAAALCGATGFQLHVSVASLHALALLTVLTLLVERGIAHAAARDAGTSVPIARTLALTVRNTVVHPIVPPVAAGMAWNLAGAPIPAPLDEVLVMPGTAVVPVRAALPQRRGGDEAEATAAIVVSALAFALTAPLWLLLRVP